MEIEQLAISKQKAEKEYQTYKEELQLSKTQFNLDMKALYAHMRHGGKVIDVWESMKLAGLNKDGDPRLAIVRADSSKVRFQRRINQRYTTLNGQTGYLDLINEGGAFYFQKKNGKWSPNWEIDVKIPNGFFPEWPKKQDGQYIKRQVETVTPIIPARLMNPLRSHKLKNYYILWEVDEWKLIPPKDPMLLKKVTPNMFLILAHWDLSPLERAVIRGRIS
jgi:hypothetical protein